MSRRTDSEYRCVQRDAWYTVDDFLKAARLGRNTYRRALAHGIELDLTPIGRNKYVEGHKGIDWLQRLAEFEPQRA